MAYVIAGLGVALLISLIFNAILYGYNSDLESVILRQKDKLDKVHNHVGRLYDEAKRQGFL